MKKKMTAMLLAAMFLTGSLNGAGTVSAAAPKADTQIVMGDVNGDGTFGVTDVVLFQKWLLAVPDTVLANWEAADFDADGGLDVFDLAMMKTALIAELQGSPELDDPDVQEILFGYTTPGSGSITVWPQNNGFAGEILINKKSVSEEDLPKVVKFLDWCNGPEGQTILNAGLEGLTYWINEDGYRYVPEDKADEASQNSKIYLHDFNQLGMGVPGNLENPTAVLNKGVTKLRERYNNLNIELAPYAVANPCFPFVSETYQAFGTQLDPIISDAAVQYIAGLIDEAGLRAAWADWAAQGGDQVTAEYNEAYHASIQ